MRTLIFAIKTAGEEWQSFDQVTVDTLTKWIDWAAKSAEEREQLLARVKHDAAFSPLTGSVVAIALYDVERGQGAVYGVGESGTADDENDSFVYKQRSEELMLREFWEGARAYDTFVTFGGRRFSVPFLVHRSIAVGVRPSRELLKYRYLSQQSEPFHIDLQDELTFYGAMGKHPSLHLFCRAYGINSPKESDQCGDSVTEGVGRQQFQTIARSAVADVTATAALYEKWLQNLAPQSFFDTAYL